MRDNDPLLQVEGLRKVFETRDGFRTKLVHAVSDVSFSVKSGEVIAIVGESGSGKSTVARLISRLVRPTGGIMRFNGKQYEKRLSRNELMALRSEIQMVFQDPFGSLNPSKTVGYQLIRPLLNFRRGLRKRHVYQKAMNALESVGLAPGVDYVEKYPHELSGGQLQRVVIAKALIVEPKLILADEPTSMLDVSVRMGILNLMKSLQRDKGLALVFITHDLASARYLSDQMYVMYAGEMVEGGPSDQVVLNPMHPYTRLLLSAVPDVKNTSLLEGTIVRGEPPDLSAPPSGCRFHTRCPMVMDICKHQVPARVSEGSGHWAACHASEQEVKRAEARLDMGW